jgi:hypothetical protein
MKEVIRDLDMSGMDEGQGEMYYPCNIPFTRIKQKKVLDQGLREQLRTYVIQQIVPIYIETQPPKSYNDIDHWLIDKRNRDHWWDKKWHFKFNSDFSHTNAQRKWIMVKSIDLKMYNERITYELKNLVETYDATDEVDAEALSDVLGKDKLLNRVYEEDVANVCASFNYYDTGPQIGGLHERNLEAQYPFNGYAEEFEIWITDMNKKIVDEPNVSGNIILNLYVER